MARFPGAMTSLAVMARRCPLLASYVHGGRRRSRCLRSKGNPVSTPNPRSRPQQMTPLTPSSVDSSSQGRPSPATTTSSTFDAGPTGDLPAMALAGPVPAQVARSRWENFGAPPTKVAWAGRKGSVFGVSSFPIKPQHQVVTGVVQRGDARGRLLGFPTANLPMTTSARLYGVWSAVVVTEDDGRHWPAAVSIGRRTTFYGRHGQLLLEAHLLDVEIELYDREISVHLVGRLRSQRRFQDVEDLVGQLARDIEDVRNWAASVSLEAGAL